VRFEPDYPRLADGSGLSVTQSWVMRCHPTRGLARYVVMILEPAGR